MLACGFRAAHSSNELDRDSGGERVRMPLQLKAALAAELQGGLVFAQTSAEHPLPLRSLQALYKRRTRLIFWKRVICRCTVLERNS